MFQRIRSWCHTQLTGHRQLPDLKQQMCRQGNNKVNPRGPSSIRSTASYFRLVIQQRDPQPCDQDIHPGPRPERVLERAGGFVRRPTPGKRRQRSPVAMRRTPQGRHSGQSKVRNNVRPGVLANWVEAKQVIWYMWYVWATCAGAGRVAVSVIVAPSGLVVAQNRFAIDFTFPHELARIVSSKSFLSISVVHVKRNGLVEDPSDGPTKFHLRLTMQKYTIDAGLAISDVAIVRNLLEKRAAIHERGAAGNWTALHIAAAQGHLSVVETLLAGNAEVCTLDGDGRSALEWAEWRGRGHVVQVLQRHERLHRLLDQQRATAHAEMSSQLFTAEARMAQLGKELAISSQDSRFGRKAAAQSTGDNRQLEGLEDMVAHLQQQNAVLEQQCAQSTNIEESLRAWENEERTCEDLLARERQHYRKSEDSLRTELECQEQRLDKVREQRDAGMEEELRHCQATLRQERCQHEEVEASLRALQGQSGPGEERFEKCESLLDSERRQRSEAQDCLKECEMREQQQRDVAECTIQKLKQELVAADERAESMQKEVVAAEEEPRPLVKVLPAQPHAGDEAFNIGLDAASMAGSTRLQSLRGAPRASETRWLSMNEIVEHRAKMVQSVEDGSLNRVATATFGHLAEGKGTLTWNNGAIPQFITQVLDHFGLHPPPSGQVYQLYTAFDRDKNGSLSLSESLRLVEAIVRAAFNIKTESARLNTSTSSVLPTSPSGPGLPSAPSGPPSVLYPVGSSATTPAPPLAQLATQALPVPSGAPVMPSSATRGYRLAQEWIEGYSVQPLTQTTMAYTPRRKPVDIADFTSNFHDTAEANAPNISRIKASLENLSLLKEALELFRACDRERRGYLSWEAGEIQSFISRVFMKQGLVPPRQEQIRSLFAAFDLDGNGRLEPRECVCMVDALARAIILAQPRSMQARAMGTLTVPAYSLAEQWLADYRPPAVLDGQTVHYPLDRSPVDLSQLAVHLRSVVPHNARHKARMIGAIESGEFLKEALRLFKECDTDRNGQLTWNEREIPKFIAKVFRKYDLMEPKEAQLYEIYRYYDGDQSYSLDVRESLCLADAVVRAMYLDSEGRSPQSRCSNRVSFSAEVSPVHSAGSHIERRRMLSDEEAARRVALQEAAMEQRFEHLMRRCNESIKERDTMAALYVVLGAWRQFAVHELAARMKEEWKLKLAEAEKKLREEQQSFQNRLEDELDRLQRTRALDTSTSVVSAVGYAEAAAQAEEEAEKRFQKERHLWEARCKEERQRRESLQAAQAAALANAANEAEKSAEARFEEERELYEQRLKEEREKRNRAEAAKAQALDHYMAEVRTQKKNAVQKVIDSLFPKTRDRAAGQLKNIASSWLSLAKAGARRRRRVGAIDKAVMSWGRKAMSGRPGPSFNAWRDVLRAKRRAHAAMGVLERQWLGGSRAGLAASYLAEWRRALDQKRQMALKAKRRSKAHAQVSLLLAQWERGRAAGLVASYLSAWKRVADAAARIRARGSRAEAVQLALQKWQRGSARGLLHEALRLWHKLCGRRRQALLVSQSLVAWEQQAEVGLVHTCFAAWLKMVLAAKREHGKQQQTEAVTLALQKWERGNKQGLLHEVLDQWYKLFVPRSRQAALLSNYLVSWEVEAEVGLLQTCAAAWRKLADGAARQRFRERSREAVHLAMEKWALGNEKGLLHEILDLWHKSCASRKHQAQLIAKCLTGMEEKSLVGLLHTCFLAWWKVGNAELQHHRKERSREAVQLVLQKWMRGKVQGLLHETLDQWHHLCVNKAQRDLLVKRYLTSWEMETQVGLAQTCLTSWKKLADALARQRSKQHGHEAVKLALQKWERGNTRGLLHEVLQEWFGLGVTHRRQAALASRYLMSWEGQSQVAIRQTCFASWRELAHAAAKLRAKQRGREAVHLAVQKWERGNVSGLLHEIMTLWQKLSATRRHRAGLIQSCMVSWRQRTEGGLLSTSLSAWRQLVEATVRQRTKERGRESIQLALQKWERGNVQGLLHEVVGQWHHLCSDRRQRAKLLGRSLLALEGHAQGALSGTILACWRQVSQAESRKRAKEHSHEAVTLALQKWERGNVSGLLHEVLHQWQKLFAGRRQKAKLLSRYLVSMEAQAGVGLLGSFHALWKQQVQVEKRQRAKEHGREAVRLALQKWERGNERGLLTETLSEWHRVRQLHKAEARRERSHQAVLMMLQTWRRPGPQGIAACAISAWARLAAKRRGRSRAAASMERQVARFLLARTGAMRQAVLSDQKPRQGEVTAATA
ncbi:rsc5 [Symbiodinium natans]|uniref:Rsc5 protein n=1 Tax=Symbiodinium natans TaxID=878477 RepID=A0A812HRM3_9DINO|nr:rsc5 [Symbiodinium natans]